jgi:hypothetical protein
VLDDPVDGGEAVEAGTGRETPADGRAGQPRVFLHPCPQLQVAAVDAEHLQVMLVAPREPVPEVGGVAHPGRPGVAGQEARDRQPRLVEQRPLPGDELRRRPIVGHG